MARIPRVFGWSVALVSALALSLSLLAQVGAQTAERCFGETSYCVSGPFRVLWEQGGLSIFGLPLGPQGLPQGITGPAEVQWFERQRFELHPANPAPYTILLGRVGAERLAQLGRDWQTTPPSPPQDGCRFFAETGRNVCGPFLAAWQARGLPLDSQAAVSYAESLALFGFPLTDAVEEEVEGQRYLVQWFERARFELHLGEGGAQLVLLGRLGAELLAAGGGGVGGTLPSDAPEALTATAVAGAATAAAPTGVATADRPAPTSTRVAPTATRRPSRPTEEPEETEEPEPSSTSVQPPTAAPPTNTARPTNTPQPTNTTQPTATPRPDPFTSPGTPPGGFAGSRTLPSASGSAVDLDGLSADDPNQDPLNIGAVLCFDVQSDDELFDVEQVFSFSDATGAELESLTIAIDENTSSLRGRWVPSIDYEPGVYTVTTTLPGANGTVISGSLNLVLPEASSGPTITLVRNTDTLTTDDINLCSQTIRGDPGDEFGAVLTGFPADTDVELFLFGNADTDATQAIYRGSLGTVRTNADGAAYFPIPTLPGYPPGNYLVLTLEQASEAFDESSFFQFWPQRFTLR